MKLKYLLTGCLLASLAWAPARTWTSSDGAKTFEGDLREFDDASGKVTVLVNGKQLVFTKDKLSEDDQSFLAEWKAEADKPDATEVLESQTIGKELTDKVLSRLDGKKFKKASMEKAPEYYLLYFSASW
ncbi:MAG: hypothetical protein ACSHYB_18035 [Roseibacillus sp.]